MADVHCTAPQMTAPPIFFHQEKFRQDITCKPVITVFKDAIAGVNTHLAKQFDEGTGIRALVYGRAMFMDVILHYAWHQFEWGEGVSLIAVGGYGRRELHPHSDIDILILLDNNHGKKYDDNIQRLITFLWDIGLEIGASVRTLQECIDIAKQDITVATNLTEMRRLAGCDKLRDTLHTETDTDHIWPIGEFYEAKWQEQRARHKKHNDSEYNLEPNVKNAPGGLRDIQMINWVAKRFFKVPTLTRLFGTDFFTEYEFAVLEKGEAFLWKVRYGLHLLASRAEERLLFEYQRELATQFGFEDNETGLAVEQFMHTYYKAVRALRELNDVLLQYLSESIFAVSQPTITPINSRFQLYNNDIEVTKSDVFLKTPSALLEIFLLIGENPEIKGVRSETIRLIREQRWLIDGKFRENPNNNALFLKLFSLDYGLISQLNRMARYGILGKYLPEFEKITGQMQHDLFHKYTVDAHTLLVVKNMRRFRYPDEEKKFPIAAHIIKHLKKPELLYIAGLYHDIGKGRGGDHSVLGAVDARTFCENHGLSKRDTNLVVWLVEKHLLMSYVSQKQDISDPEVIRQFATEMGDQLHLDFLYALTVADMCGTNPEVWNTWRASLMRQLYLETKRALGRGLESPLDQQEIIEDTQLLALGTLADRGISEQAALKVWKELGDEYFVRESHVDIAWQTQAILDHKDDQPMVLMRETTHYEFEGATQIFLHVKDAPHIFTAVVNVLAQHSLNVQDARIYSAANGFTCDTFYVLDENDQPLGEDPQRYQQLQNAILEELQLLGDYRNVVRRRTPRQFKQFSTPTLASISTDIATGNTILEVISPDRTGLLATIGLIFMDMDVQLLNAKISTLGERVEDIFIIADAYGNAITDPKFCELLRAEICQRLDSQLNKELAV